MFQFFCLFDQYTKSRRYGNFHSFRYKEGVLEVQILVRPEQQVDGIWLNMATMLVVVLLVLLLPAVPAGRGPWDKPVLGFALFPGRIPMPTFPRLSSGLTAGRARIFPYMCAAAPGKSEDEILQAPPQRGRPQNPPFFPGVQGRPERDYRDLGDRQPGGNTERGTSQDSVPDSDVRNGVLPSLDSSAEGAERSSGGEGSFRVESRRPEQRESLAGEQGGNTDPIKERGGARADVSSRPGDDRPREGQSRGGNAGQEAWARPGSVGGRGGEGGGRARGGRGRLSIRGRGRPEYDKRTVLFSTPHLKDVLCTGKPACQLENSLTANPREEEGVGGVCQAHCKPSTLGPQPRTQSTKPNPPHH